MECADRNVEEKGRENDWEEVFQLEAETEKKFVIKSATIVIGLTNQTAIEIWLWERNQLS